MEDWRDASNGGCAMGNAEASSIVAAALQHVEGTRCHQLAYIVMPNHVHTLFATLANEQVTDLVQSWKDFTSHKLKQLLG